MAATSPRIPRRPTRAETDALARCLAETVSRCIPISVALAALTLYAMERRYLPRVRTPTLLVSALTGYAVANFTVQRRCQDRLCRAQPVRKDSPNWEPPTSRDLYRAYPGTEPPVERLQEATRFQDLDEYISNPDLDYAVPRIPLSELPVENSGSQRRKQPQTTYEHLRANHRSHKVIVPVSQRRKMVKSDVNEFIAGQPN